MSLPLEEIKITDLTQVPSDQFEFPTVDDPILEMAYEESLQGILNLLPVSLRLLFTDLRAAMRN